MYVGELAMIEEPVVHPHKDRLIEFGQGRLNPEESATIEQHLEVCSNCCETLLDLEDDTFIALLRDSKAQTENERMAGQSSGHAATIVSLTPSASTTPDPLAELSNHPRYRIIELIGQGGMGKVYKAEHRLMNRPVAIKLINSQLVQNGQAVERFRREVQAAARLSHPNIVTAYDAEQAGGTHFLVMEFVKGVDLATIVNNRGPLSVVEACDFVRQAAGGLQHAHEQGMVHRDIKPHNLMLSVGHQVRILDFGLAGFAAESAWQGGVDQDIDDPATGATTSAGATPPGDSPVEVAAAHLTALGSVMGTPDYMAPEQAADAHSADIRADIYSLGCTLHFLLTGKPPFEADNVLMKLKAHAEKSPPVLKKLRNDVPDELANVVARMMAKNSAERFQTPAAVAEALAPFSHSVQTRPRRRTLRNVLAAAAAILLAGVIYITTDKGRIEIRTEVDDLDVVVSQGGEEIKTIDLATGSHVTWMPSGDYTISLKQDRNDIQINPSGFTLSRWGKQIVNLTLKRQHNSRDLPAGAMSEIVTTGFNGSFEVTKSGLPVTWFFYTPRTVPSGDFDIVMDTTDFKEGEQSLKFVVRKCESTGGRLSPGFFNEFHIENHNPPGPFETKPGETYKISFWAKNAGSEFVFKARGVSALKGDPGAVIRSKETINEWRRFECTYTIPPNMWLRLELNVVQPGTFWIDDIQIVRVNEKAPVAATVLNDNARLQSKWVPVSALIRGKELSAEQLARMSITLDGNRAEFTDPDSGQAQAGTVTIDAARSPKHIDFIAPDGKERMPGIFEFNGEHLKLAWCDGDYARPSDFQPAETPDHMTAVLKRVPGTVPTTVMRDAPAAVLDPAQREVVKSAEAYLAVMDEGRFGALRDILSSWAKQQATRDQISQTYQKLRDTFGKASRRTLHRVQVYDELPGLPEGRYAGVQYKTDFERQNGLWESLLLNIDSDGRWRVNTYTNTLEPMPLPDKKQDPATEDKKEAALAAAHHWLKVVDAGKYGEAWDTSAKLNKDGITRDAMDLAYKGLFQPLGALKSRALKTSEYKTQLPGAPAGEYAVIQFSTRFTNQRVIETVVLTREADGQWRASGYFHAEDKSAPTPPPGIPIGVNLLTDSSFENTAPTLLPRGWSAWLDDGPDFRCEVVAGGHTGQRCLRIYGKGTRGVVFANVIPADRSKRYALKGWAKFEGDKDARAIIKFNYFKDNQFLGVHDLIGVTADRSGWHLIEKTDALDRYPDANKLYAMCHVEGNGSGWFDDVEVIAYDRDKLPIDFDSRHGRHNRLSGLHSLERWRGAWETKYVFRETDNSPETALTMNSTAERTLGDYFLMSHSKATAVDEERIQFLTFDQNIGAFRQWLFSSNGKAFEWRGQWDDAAKSLELRMLPDASRMSSVERFTDGEHIEGSMKQQFVMGTKDAGRWTATRKAATAKVDVPTVNAPAATPAELELLSKFVGEWTIRETAKPSVWIANGHEKISTEKVAWVLGGKFLMARAFDDKGKLTTIWLATYEPLEKSYRFWFFSSEGWSGQWRVTWDASSRGFHWRSIDMPTGWIGTGFNRWINDDTFDNQALIKDENGRVLLDSTQDKRRKN
jgi:uncharacterized protein (TIGR03067 family)